MEKKVQSKPNTISRKYCSEKTNKCFSVRCIKQYPLRSDCNLKTIHEGVQCFYKIFLNRLSANPLIKNLSSLTVPGNPPRRLKCKWCKQLLQ